ncbi:MAG: tRNA (adenosine(37)-N6)-dimethylallyltransferase MiaA [Wenzhouxiangella sp.]
MILTGPTAAGKTAAAEWLHDHFPVRLISVDSAQVYRGLDIGSAKPDAAQLARYPHALIDLRWPEQTYSAADFVADAEAAMHDAAAAGKIPVLVGGTLLYLRALLYGLDPLPPADPDLRAALKQRAQRQGWAALHAELAQRDPATAARIRPSDPQRIQRALEVLNLTGRGLAAHYSESRQARFPSLRLVLTPADRAELHRRIAVRLRSMLAAGLIEEVAELRRTRPGLCCEHPSMRAVGYRQVWAYLDGKFDRAALMVRAAAATRQLAKRQLTGLRKFVDTLWYDPNRSTTLAVIGGQVDGFIERTLTADRKAKDTVTQ